MLANLEGYNLRRQETMDITGAMGISTAGMAAQGTRLAAIASTTASLSGGPGLAPSPSPAAAGTSGGAAAAPGNTNAAGDADLQTEVTGMIETRSSFAANAKAFESGADMWDVLMSMKRD